MDGLNPWIVGGVVIGAFLLFRGGSSGAPDTSGAALQSQSIATAQNTQLGSLNIQGYTQRALASTQAGSNRDDIFSQAVQARLMHETDLAAATFNFASNAANVAAQTHKMGVDFVNNITANTAFFRAQEARARADERIAQQQINAQTKNTAIQVGGGLLSNLIGLFK